MIPDEVAASLRHIAQVLSAHVAIFERPEISTPLVDLEAAATQAAKAWSGSSLGYHSRVYYKNLQPPPAGARFSSEWGFAEAFSNPTRGDWVEYEFDHAVDMITTRAGSPDLAPAESAAARARQDFGEQKAEVVSILTAFLGIRADQFLAKALEDASELSPLSASAAAKGFLPGGTVMSRDAAAITAGVVAAPHQVLLSQVITIRDPVRCCTELASIARRSAAHVDRLTNIPASADREVGNRVFLGHGRSPQWRELKDFIQDRLGLPWDEFNRVPVAGITNVARLVEMLDSAGIAFLILTAEDERIDGSVSARLNVIHEAGLFQGRLGFSRAIVVLEEGCAEFSNIQGLGQIRFPTGKIASAFEDVRRVLEREDLVDPG